MRNVVLGVGISLDGYIARLNDAVDFLFMPKDYSMAEFMSSVDTLILGRKTMDGARKLGGTFDGSMPAYVFSKSKPPGQRDGVIFVNQTPARLMAQLRKRKGKLKGKDIWLMGGGEIARAFLKADLVDGLYLGVVPVVLGAGIPLFPSGFPQRNFTLVENKTFSKGLISLKYKRARSKSKPKS